ncbi:hypothetical protein AAVH_19185 [Aphelenchoides avenae]|nr:hypothetical protein AAVH_19185 [Aphelenchus avenae]
MDAYDPPELPPHELKLKVGSIIILLRSLDVKRSLCNGTRLLVTRLGTQLIEAVHVIDGLQMKKVWIPRIAFHKHQSHVLSFTVWDWQRLGGHASKDRCQG